VPCGRGTPRNAASRSLSGTGRPSFASTRHTPTASGGPGRRNLANWLMGRELQRWASGDGQATVVENPHTRRPPRQWRGSNPKKCKGLVREHATSWEKPAVM
jgi:hypothetical protein